MKKIFLAVLFSAFLIASTSMAHPPNEIIAEFDLTNRVLSVKIAHNVGGDTSHYIEKLTVNYNGEEVIVQQTSRQLSDIQTFLYFMPEVKAGDEIEILAVCSIFGQRNFKFTVEDNQ